MDFDKIWYAISQVHFPKSINFSSTLDNKQGLRAILNTTENFTDISAEPGLDF